jgi:hypothetical protein
MGCSASIIYIHWSGAAVVQGMQEFIRCCWEYRIYQKVQIGGEADNLVKIVLSKIITSVWKIIFFFNVD